MQCTLCNLLHLGKNETPFKIRLSIHRKEVKDPEAILVDEVVIDSTKASFTISNRLTNTNLDKEIFRESLVQREN